MKIHILSDCLETEKIEQYLFDVINQQIIDIANLSEKDFGSDILPDRILNELGFSHSAEQFTETTYTIGTLLYFLRNRNINSFQKSFSSQENKIDNAVSAFGISCELEKLRRKRKIKKWKSANPLGYNSPIKIDGHLHFCSHPSNNCLTDIF